MTYGADVCQDLRRATRLEWLEPNGIGGFASGTVSGIATRRYHALLVASLRPPTDRTVTLAALDETLHSADGASWSLASHAYPGAVHPHGYRHIVRFDAYPYPTWHFALPDGTRIEKSVASIHGRNLVVVVYRLLEGVGGVFDTRPHLAWRDYHALQREDATLSRPLDAAADLVTYRPPARYPPLAMRHSGAAVSHDSWWVRQKRYAVEADERGLDHLEDHWSPGSFIGRLTPDCPSFWVVAGVGCDLSGDGDTLLASERQRRESASRPIVVADWVSPPAADFLRESVRRGGDYIVRRGDSQWTILAGYPWFTDWGRDTMIALPGLTIARGEAWLAREVLDAFASYCDGGMIPNRFPDTGETPSYNTADATLWFVEAIRRYAVDVPDDPVVRDSWYPTLKSILEAHRFGTRYGIAVDDDGLLHAGVPGSQLTWMDAKIGDWVATPRVGKPVEINALWHSALRTVERLARTYGDDSYADMCAEDADRARAAFRARFPNPRSGALYDVIDGPDGDDPTLRPNQVIAISLHYRCLDRADEQRVMRRVTDALHTPFGLRTLPPNHPGYAATYDGDARRRDSIYHQGPVWSWLWGPYVTAYRNAFGDGHAFRAQLADWLNRLALDRDAPGIGGVAELYDGHEPHRARGCPWQAWSLAEVLRAAWDAGAYQPSPKHGGEC